MLAKALAFVGYPCFRTVRTEKGLSRVQKTLSAVQDLR